MSKPIPTERKVLRCIYDMYSQKYPYQQAASSVGRVMVPIDIAAVAKRLRCNEHLIFGYLYYHLNHKHSYKASETSSVPLFAPTVGDMRDAVNFPYLAAILAGHDQEHSKFVWSLGISLVALALSVAAIVVQIVTASSG